MGDGAVTAEEERLDATRARARRPGGAGGRTCPSGSGAPCARTTAPTAPRGNTCRTITRARAPIAGARTASPASATTQQQLCFALALWNGADPILKERMFGLTGNEGNHGEDVKEYYFYLDNVPSHAYMKYLYKYPQRAFPYADLVDENRRRTRADPEYELLDTGIFDDDRYFDVFVEYAKAGPDRHPDPHQRDQSRRRPGAAAPAAHAVVQERLVVDRRRDKPRDRGRPRTTRTALVLQGHASRAGRRIGSTASAPDEVLFTENETNAAAPLRRAQRVAVRQGRVPRVRRRRPRDAVNPAQVGTKAAPHYAFPVGAGETVVVRLRLTAPAICAQPLGAAFDAMFDAAQAGGRRVLPARHAVRHARRHAQRAAAGVRRHAVEQAVLPLHGRALARRRSRPSRRRRSRASRAATTTGGTSRPPTCCRCRTSGSTRGSPRGTWRSTRSRSR